MLETVSLCKTKYPPGIELAFQENVQNKSKSNNARSNFAKSKCPPTTSKLSRAEFVTRLVVRLVSNSQNLEEAAVMDTNRGSSQIARARQIAMYLLHTSLCMPYSTVAKLFGRDRTTVAHACRTIEDLRDIPASDDAILKMEAYWSC
ncbi:MAG: helix-turn-helix domain-containing protein [Rhizobiaceae bacterium]